MLVSFYVPTFHTPLPPISTLFSPTLSYPPLSRRYPHHVALRYEPATPPTATISLMRISPEGLTAISRGDERVGIPGEREWVHQVLADLAFHPVARFSLPSAFSTLLARVFSLRSRPFSYRRKRSVSLSRSFWLLEISRRIDLYPGTPMEKR